jgi:hypothetical protein
MRELIEKYQSGARELSTTDLNKEDLLALVGGSEWDTRILLQLRELQADKPRALLQKVIREGGSVALLVDRGEEHSPFVLKRALAKLAELGIELEVD